MKDLYQVNKFDMPLTRLGMMQSMATGEYLRQYFEHNDYKFSKVIIECSPFLRCMMTAGQIAQRLKVKDITINYRASEILLKYFWFNLEAKNPLPDLEFTKYSFDFKWMTSSRYYGEKYFPKGVSFKEDGQGEEEEDEEAAEPDFKKEIFTTHPETKQQGQ